MPDIAKLRILTADSVDRLRVEAAGAGAATVWTNDLSSLEAMFELTLIESEHDIDTSQGLLMSSPDAPFRELDATNSERMLAALPTLTPADATDERLWVTLALGPYRDYVVDRWPSDPSRLGNHVINHIFASTGRGRERDHAIARLWWTGYYVRRFAPTELGAGLKTMFSNSDLSVQVLGRPNLATVGTIAHGVLKVFRTHFLDQGIRYDRRGVRAFLEGVDFLAGRRALGTLPQDEVDSMLEASFREHLGLNGATLRP